VGTNGVTTDTVQANYNALIANVSAGTFDTVCFILFSTFGLSLLSGPVRAVGEDEDEDDADLHKLAALGGGWERRPSPRVRRLMPS
jgi:hypothetical protein